VGEWIDAHSKDEDLFIDRELTTVLQKTPGFPSGEGARLFPQTRALLFAGELQSPDAAADSEKILLLPRETLLP
jgi:hypothetical protein